MYLPSHYSVGTGIIINCYGTQSNETDIIIYDNRILPPFIREGNLGVYPAESVIATIEIKSNLTKEDIISANTNAKKLHDKIYNHKLKEYKEYKEYKPICCIMGFWNKSVLFLIDRIKGEKWILENLDHLLGMCLIKRFCWMKVRNWSLKKGDENYEETKRFIAVLLDNIRTLANLRIQHNVGHKDWISLYIRNQ